jgi:ring-1,2-phenylacetyl-CoA epoxidase subunit PaaC
MEEQAKATNKALSQFLLHCADSTLILAQRNSEYCGHGPILEQDIALSNIALDLLGQARYYYQYAAEILNRPDQLDNADKHNSRIHTEDSLAYHRTEREFLNCLLLEQPNGDWGQTVMRQFFFSAYQFFFYQQLTGSPDTQLAAIAEKALKEVQYHLRWSSEWVIRLGDGTEESHEKMLNALEQLYPYTGELFIPADYERSLALAGIIPDCSAIRPLWLQEVKQVLVEACLPLPDEEMYMYSGGKNGLHTEMLGFILAEMQYLQRTYPNAVW